MRSGSERMHAWRRTPSTGRNFQTLIIWITVSSKASCNSSISVSNFFFLDFFNFCWVFQTFPFFCVTLYVKNSVGTCSYHCAYTSSSLGATTAIFERFASLNIHFPLIAILDVASPSLYFQFPLVISYFIFPSVLWSPQWSC